MITYPNMTKTTAFKLAARQTLLEWKGHYRAKDCVTKPQ
jgi:hypothetical protein